MLDTLSILAHFQTDCGAQVDAVLDSWGADCQFGANLGVVKSANFEVQTRQMPFLGFFQISGFEGEYCGGVKSCSYGVFAM